MKDQTHPHRSQRKNLVYWLVGLGSLIWLLLRSGTKPRRLTYPCQRAALASSLGFMGYLVSLLGGVHLYRRLRRKTTLAGLAFSALVSLLIVVLRSSNAPTPSTYADLTLPGWTSPTAVSNVFVVPNVPVPGCSLDGGALPDTLPCSDPSFALHDNGVDRLVNEMESQGNYFYRTAGHPDGIVGAVDVVIIKINNQWGLNGYNNGVGRLVTNNDLLKGLIWRVLQHPDGFSGEVVVAENTQNSGATWDTTPANAQDQNQSYRDMVNAFQSIGYPVSTSNWSDLNDDLISGGDVGGGGYPVGEYIHGNMDNAYILLEDPAGTGVGELSYPKFQTAGGTYVSMRYGVWNGGSYDAGLLTFINMPVLKKHGMAGSTIAWKNLIGFITTLDTDNRYGGGSYGWDEMHDFYWGYTGGTNRDYGLLGREMALIRTPDLNVVDAIWVGYEDNYDGDASRQDILLASTDPFAVDWYASEYVLRPLVAWDSQDSSAARAGVFRDATRTNQNAAKSVWPGGAYPYIDLLDAYDGSTPSNDERDQMNAYVVTGEPGCQPIVDLSISGPALGYTDTLYAFTAVIVPADASIPITYTWSPEPGSGQGAAEVEYQWSMTGCYTITLDAENCGGSNLVDHIISIAGELWSVYLPIVLQ